MAELINAKGKIKLGKAPGADEIYPAMVTNHEKMQINYC